MPSNPVPRRSWLADRAGDLGARVAAEPVCRGHCAPLDFLERWFFDPPPMSLVVGPRGGGKSYLSALHTHLESILYPRLGTRILGGSMSQSEQIYHALSEFHAGPTLMSRLTKQQAEYRVTGSTVAILAATPTSVRGPHVARLKLDEVDEIEDDIRDSAFGMCMARHGVPAAAMMTSTWHRVGGPMSQLIDRARGGDFPLYTFCVFEVLERCPEERSGRDLEKCPECPLFTWCHADRDADPEGRPKAKRSSGHYAIDSLIQKVRAVSKRVFEADYLCSGPKADGLWFPGFDPAAHVSEDAEYDPDLPAYLAIDCGVFTAAAWFQVREGEAGDPEPRVSVFADYVSEGATAEANARAILELSRSRCNGKVAKAYMDPAGKARTSIGPTVVQEYARAGLPVEPWPLRPVSDGLALVESFLTPADGTPRLALHPRCVALARAFGSYRRAKVQGQWRDYPADPQHDAEDLMDALRGGLVARFPEGRRPAARPHARASARAL